MGNKKAPSDGAFSLCMAEKEGFEPSIEFPLYTLSRGMKNTPVFCMKRSCGAGCSV